MQVHIDLPIFSSDTEAYGYFSGDIEVLELPEDGRAFPWPSSWLTKHQDIFSAQSNQVWGISDWPHGDPRKHITMYGLGLNSREEAVEVVRHIEAVSGIQFWAHDLPDLEQT